LTQTSVCPFVSLRLSYTKTIPVSLRTQSSLDEGDTSISPTTTTSTAFSSLGFGGNVPSSDSSVEPDPHAVSQTEALSYYAGLPSEPTLIYRTGKPWSPPSGPEAQRRKKELRPVFNHDIVELWSNGLGDEVVEVMDTHNVSYRHFTIL
jgi:hypothetical protein